MSHIQFHFLLFEILEQQSLWEHRCAPGVRQVRVRCVSGVLPAVVTVLTPVRFLLAVSPVVSEQRAAIDGRIRTLCTPVRLLT